MLFNSCVTITPVGSIKVRASFVLSAFADKTDLSQKIYSIYVFLRCIFIYLLKLSILEMNVKLKQKSSKKFSCIFMKFYGLKKLKLPILIY